MDLCIGGNLMCAHRLTQNFSFGGGGSGLSLRLYITFV